MISFRQHVVSLLAVFLALAIGVVLGGGPLSEVGRADDGPRATAPTAGADPAAAYAESFTGVVAPGLVGGRLAERGVAVVTLPGASEELVAALEQQVAAAGGVVTGRFAAGEPLVSAGEKSLVDTLGSQLMTQLAEDGGEPAVDPASSTYDRIGQLLGIAVAGPAPEGAKVDGTARAITQGMAGAGLLSAPETIERKAPLVLVVLGTDETADGSEAIVPGLLSGLSRAAAGVVVAGTLADGAGALVGVRADPVSAQVASVDGIDTTAGRVATVLALARALTVKGGSFGASGADGPIPTG